MPTTCLHVVVTTITAMVVAAGALPALVDLMRSKVVVAYICSRAAAALASVSSGSHATEAAIAAAGALLAL